MIALSAALVVLGALAYDLARRVLTLKQPVAPHEELVTRVAAYGIGKARMAGADKDSVRLAAAVRVLQVAGVPMGEPKTDVSVTLSTPATEAALITDDDLDRALAAPPSVN